jgi:hypothetical protein
MVIIQDNCVDDNKHYAYVEDLGELIGNLETAVD